MELRARRRRHPPTDERLEHRRRRRGSDGELFDSRNGRYRWCGRNGRCRWCGRRMRRRERLDRCRRRLRSRLFDVRRRELLRSGVRGRKRPVLLLSRGLRVRLRVSGRGAVRDLVRERLDVQGGVLRLLLLGGDLRLLLQRRDLQGELPGRRDLSRRLRRESVRDPNLRVRRRQRVCAPLHEPALRHGVPRRGEVRPRLRWQGGARLEELHHQLLQGEPHGVCRRRDRDLQRGVPCPAPLSVTRR